MRKVFKVTLYILGSIILLLVGAVVFLNSRWGQDFVRAKAEAFLRNKIKTEVHIGRLGYGVPKFIVLNDVLFLDQVRDTLLSVGTLKVDLDMFKLLKSRVDVQEVVLTNVHSHIYRNRPDTAFNFTYIINAFTGSEPNSPQKPKDTSAALTFSLDHVLLDDIHMRFNDFAGGLQFGLNLDHLDLRMKKLDLDKMMFHVKDLAVSGLQTTYSQDSSFLPVSTTSTAGNDIQLIADNVNLKQILFQYNDNINKFLFGLNLGELQLQLNKFALGNDNIIDIKKLATKNTNVVLTMGSETKAPAFVDSLVKIDSTEGWNINAKDVDFAGVGFKMDDRSKPRQKLGMDYFHLDFKNTILRMTDFSYTYDTISGSIKNFSGTEQCGLDVRKLTTDFNYNQQGATLSKLYFQTPKTIVQDRIEVHYPSVTAVAKDPGLLQLDLHIVNSILGLHDVLMFAPQLKDQDIFRKYKNGWLNVEATVTGFLKKMDIAHLYVAGMDNTEVRLTGKVGGMPDPKAISYDLNIQTFKSSRKDVSFIIPDSLLTSVRIPDRFGFTGQISGNMSDFNTNIYLMSTDGNAYVKGSVLTSPGEGNETYDLTVKTDQLHLGRILKQDSLLGTVTANLKVKGRGFDVKTMIATADGDIFSAYVKGYRYHDIVMYGKVAGREGDINLRSMDSNLQVQVTAHGDFKNKYPAVVADINIDSMDLHALKLYATPLRARGVIHADFPVLNPDYPQGEFVWWQPVIVADGKRYFMDSVYVISKPTADGQHIFANLDVMQATITGKTPLTKIGSVIQDHINRHYSLPVKDSLSKAVAKIDPDGKDFRIKVNPSSMVANGKAKADTTIPADYSLFLNARIIDKPLLHSLLPGLTSFDSIHADATLRPTNLIVNANVPNLVYGSTIIKNGRANVSGSDSAFTYKVTVDEVKQNKFVFSFADIHGDLDKNVLSTNVSLSDPSHKERFALAATLTQSGDSQVIQLQPGLKLDYNEWAVAQPNRIVLARGGVYVQNFEISNTGQFIKAQSNGDLNSPLKVDISNFRLANITNVISGSDTLIADGVLGGTVTLDRLTPSPQLTADLHIDNLVVLRDTLGNMQLQVNNKTENVLNTKLTLKGQGNDISVTGSYFLQPFNGNDLDLNVDVNALALHSFETIAMNEIRNSSGYIRGNLKVKGKMMAPRITGELRTDNLITTISRLNAQFKMPAEKIVFNDQQITFNDFTISDPTGNKAVITGDIGTAYLPELDFNLSINAKNWQALHSTVKDNKEYYGDLMLTTNLKIKGTSYAPSVDGNLFILPGTKLTVINPSATPQLQSDKGIIEFVNMRDTTAGKYLVVAKKDSASKRKFAAGSEINVNITVPKEAEFNLVIDQASGDFLTVKGDAFLNTAVTPGGVVTLNGSYALHSGSYQFNYNFIKRKFLIKDGSMITFAGDPIKGTNLDITATYEAKIPPYDLVMRQVPDPVQLNYFKQSLPFDVNLNLKGPVMQPVISFDVVLPETKVYPLAPDQIELVQGKLSQLRMDTTEMNKQVFAVLILGRFVSDDPFSSSSTGLSYTAMQSVSTFIGEQLNQAAGKLVKGVDISVGLASIEDYTTGSLRRRTDLNLAASKRLMNDRLKLTIGNDFELEGPQTNSQQSSYVPSNLAADYLLTADGRYTLRAYRRNYDEGVLQGFVTETGLNFIVSLDYNRFKNLFMKRKRGKNQSVKNQPAATGEK